MRSKNTENVDFFTGDPFARDYFERKMSISMNPIEVKENTDLKWDWPLAGDDGNVKVFEDEDHFEVGLEAKYFGPREIEVKAIGELLEVHLEHTPRKNEIGSVARNITRCYKMPKNVDVKTLKSNLDSRGILHIKASKRH